MYHHFTKAINSSKNVDVLKVLLIKTCLSYNTLCLPLNACSPAVSKEVMLMMWFTLFYKCYSIMQGAACITTTFHH